jgi:PHD/YefM family antitoxin component YafN of YafNO toxin-antitoxin module
LVAEPEDTFTVTTGKDLATGEDKEEPKTWLLHEFMETGAALRYIEIVRPFAHVARADLRCFLLTINSEDEPVRVTSQQVAALGQLIEEYDEETMVKAYELADGMEDYLAHGAEYIQQVKDKEDADYVNSVAQTIGCANSDDLKQHKAAFSAAILKLAGQIGRVRAQIAIRKSGPWKGRSLEDFLRFCEEAGKKAGEA